MKSKQNYREEATRFLENNPNVKDIFKKFVKEALDKRKPFGFALIRERVRWEVFYEKDSEEEYKFNNSYSPYIARALIEEFPDLSNYMQIRKVKY